LGEYPVAEFSDLLDRSGLGLVRGAALCNQRIDQIGDLQQALSQVRLIGETLIQTS